MTKRLIKKTNNYAPEINHLANIINSKVTTAKQIAACMQQKCLCLPKKTIEQVQNKFVGDEEYNWYANAVIYEDMGTPLEYKDLIKSPKHKDVWSNAQCRELCRLAQGYKNKIQGTDIIFFIHKIQLPVRRKVIYTRIVCDI